MCLQGRNSDCKNSIFPRSKRYMHYTYMHTDLWRKTHTVIFMLCKMWCLLWSWWKAATTQLVFCDSLTLTQVRVDKNKVSTNMNFSQYGNYGNEKDTFSNSSLKLTVSVLATVLNGYCLVFPSQRTHSKICIAQVPETLLFYSATR